MVQIIENWADVRGTIRGVTESSSPSGFVTAAIDVEAVLPVAGYANMFEQAAGHTLSVNIPQSAAERLALRAGKVVTCRVRRGGPSPVAFAHPEGICELPA